MGTGDKHHAGGEDHSPSIDELTRQAHKRLQRGDLQGAMAHYERAVEEAKSSSDPTVKISSYLNAGACLVSMGHYRRGLGLLESACKTLKKIRVTAGGSDDETEVEITSHKLSPTSSKPVDCNLYEMSADVYYNRGVASQGLQEFKKAVTSFRTSIDHYLKAGAKAHAAEGFSSLAKCYREAGQIEEEIGSHVSAQQLYRELEAFSSEAMVCVDLAKVYLRIGRKDECRKMLATAKLQAMRVDDPRIQGKLHSQFGLLCTSLGSFEEAIQNFEKALPLVRSGERSVNSVQVEAALLQNIGAAYNELGRYFDAVIYHREAASLHGKNRNLISECKCLCNLAFAQAQLKDYPESAKNFSNALAKAHKARNNYIQFQASEGLGSINYHMGRYGEAASYFKQALEILNEIKQETGIPRERVMEKLSDAEEALQIMKAKQRQRDFSRSRHSRTEGDSATARRSSASGSSSDENGGRKGSPHSLRQRLSPEFENDLGEGSSSRHRGTKERQSLTERRGVSFLPPIEVQTPSKKHAVLRKKGGSGKTHLPPLALKESREDRVGARGRTKLERRDSLDAEVQEYLKTYQESESTAEEVDLPQHSPPRQRRHSDDDEHRTDSGDHLRVFSRHARHTPTNASPQEGGGGGGGVGMASPRFEPVTEGCLALGPNTRQLYTTQTRIVKKGRKKRRINEIVPITPAPADSPGRTSPAPPTPAAPGPSPAAASNGTRTSNQSKICVIL